MGNSCSDVLPDCIRPYLDEIAERLYSGHAAVMVGAGFSKNVVQNGSNVPTFPDWNQLGDVFYRKLYGNNSDESSKYLNILKLADEVEAKYGRPVLEKLLTEEIPDSTYEPSLIHEKLLNLPWSDVFTTNYDTLLERARILVTSRRYDLIVDKKDIVFSEKPRIVKLHGSLPTGPFVITEEDYRRYPDRFSPFVNTVQQTLLENTLCLVGFSGDDPNFLQWIGWIRDELGQQKAPKMFLIGVLNLSDAQVRLLDRRNIVPIDLVGDKDSDRPHHYYLELFLDYLSDKNNQRNSLKWPHSNIFATPNESTEKLTQIQQLIPVWKSDRESYPNWVVVPEDRRSILWQNTSSWIDHISTINDLPEFLDLEFTFELSWRMERCLCPFLDSQVPYLESLLVKYSSLGSSDTPTEVTDKSLSVRGLNYYQIRKMYQHLQLQMLRFYREEGRREDWYKLCNTITNTQSLLPAELQASFNYERCLYSLFEMDLKGLYRRLSEWPYLEFLPYWNVKKAGMLAETGRLGEAEELLKSSLTNIRSKLNLKPVRSDYSLVSEESYVMFLLRWIQTSVAIQEVQTNGNSTTNLQAIPDQFSDRWNFLKQYKCDPSGELRTFEHLMERPQDERPTITEKEEFDIGRVTRTRRFMVFDQETMYAYHLLRFCEDVGLPLRIPGGELSPRAIENALTRISKYSSHWAMVTLVRNGDDRAVERIFNRSSLSNKTTEFVDNLVDIYLKSLERYSDEVQSGNRYTKNNRGVVLAGLVPEILSRLCCKCSDKSKIRILNFLRYIYQADSKATYKGTKYLTIRLFQSFPVKQRWKLIPKILEFPVMESLSPLEESEFINPFVILSNLLQTPDLRFGTNLPANKFKYLLGKAYSDNSTSRKWAIHTIGFFYKIEGLNNIQQKQFADALWSNLDEFGLPAGTDYLKSYFLNLPHPSDVQPYTLVREYIRTERFSTSRYGDLPIYEEVVQTSKHTKWSEEDSVDIFDRLVEWWDAGKGNLLLSGHQGMFGTLADEFKSEFANLVNVLTGILRPSYCFDQRKETLLRLVSELRDYNCPALRLESACLHICPDWRSNVLERMDRGLAADDSSILNDCFRAIITIAERTEDCTVKRDFSSVLDSLGQIVRMQKNPGLSNAFRTITSIVKDHPWAFTKGLESKTLFGLEKSILTTKVSAGAQTASAKLEVRMEAAELAYVLYKFHLERQQDIPDVIAEWKSICSSAEEFAEIKNVWLS